MTPATDTYSRGQLAKLTDVKAETIRYYENCGLLDAPARSAGGHRIYTSEHEKRLIFIRRCRALGFAIVEIKGLLRLADTREQTCEQVRQVTAIHLSDVRSKIKDLKKMEKTLRIMIQHCDTNTTPNCPIINDLSA